MNSNTIITRPFSRNKRRIKDFRGIALGMLAFIGIACSPPIRGEELRDWTNRDGRTIQGILEEAGPITVKLKGVTGAVFELPLGSLSDKDQAYVRSKMPSTSGTSNQATSRPEVASDRSNQEDSRPRTENTDSKESPSTVRVGFSNEQREAVIALLEKITQNYNVTAGLVETAAKEGYHAQSRMLTILQYKYRELSVHVFHLSTMEDFISMIEDPEALRTAASLLVGSYREAANVRKDLEVLVAVSKDIDAGTPEFVLASRDFIENVISELFDERRAIYQSISGNSSNTRP